MRTLERGEHACGLDDEVDVVGAPRDVHRIALGKDGDGLAVDDEAHRALLGGVALDLGAVLGVARELAVDLRGGGGGKWLAGFFFLTRASRLKARG